MKILIKDALILPMTGEGDEIRGSIAIEDGLIRSIGNVETTFDADTVIDASSCLALPGLINSHTHASMQYFKNFNDTETNLQSWLQSVWTYEAEMNKDDVYWGTLAAIAEMIASGTTCFNDMYFFIDETARAIQETGMKGTIGLTLFGDEQDSQKRIDASLSSLLALREETHGIIDFSIAPHAPYTCTDGTFRLASDISREYNVLLHTHMSESLYEVQQSIDTLGRSPAEHLDTLNALGEKSVCAHVVHTSDDDIAIIKKRNVSIIHNPSSNCKLSNGIAPVRKYLDQGIRVALGTDGSSSNNTLDMFREMRLAAMISASQGNAITPYEILTMATRSGAEVLNRLESSGTLEVGKDADIILIDTGGIHTTPLNDPYSAIVYTLASSDVTSVLIRGELVYHEKRFTAIELETIKRQLLTRWDAMKTRVAAKGEKNHE